MSIYDSDFYSWTQEQAALLRAGNLAGLDAVNLLEEIESMGRREYDQLESRFELLYGHLLKFQYQPGRAGSSWDRTVKEQRRKIPVFINRNPGLKGKLEEIMQSGWRQARRLAHDETGLPLQFFPDECPWTYEQVLSPDFYPEPIS